MWRQLPPGNLGEPRGGAGARGAAAGRAGLLRCWAASRGPQGTLRSTGHRSGPGAGAAEALAAAAGFSDLCSTAYRGLGLWQ